MWKLAITLQGMYQKYLEVFQNTYLNGIPPQNHGLWYFLTKNMGFFSYFNICILNYKLAKYLLKSNCLGSLHHREKNDMGKRDR